MIDLIASASFGVYLIHNNSVTKPWLIPYSLTALLRRALTWAERRLQV